MNRKTREPSEMMKVSLLWKLYSHDRIDEDRVDPALFEEAYTSQHGTLANQNGSCGDLCFKRFCSETKYAYYSKNIYNDDI